MKLIWKLYVLETITQFALRHSTNREWEIIRNIQNKRLKPTDKAQEKNPIIITIIVVGLCGSRPDISK